MTGMRLGFTAAKSDGIEAISGMEADAATNSESMNWRALRGGTAEVGLDIAEKTVAPPANWREKSLSD